MRLRGSCLAMWVALAATLTSLSVVVMGQTQRPTTVTSTTPLPPSTAKPTPTAEDPNTKEIGIILTTYAQYEEHGTFAQMRHLPVMPYYQNYSGPVPGIGFSNPYIHFLSVDIDYRLKQIYMYDYHLRSIAVGYNYHREMVPADMAFQFMHIGVSKGTIQVAVDWVTHTVYWSDSLYRWVVAAAGEKEKIQEDYYKIIIDTHLFAPEAIALDPLKGLMFVCDGGPHPKIEVSSMTGAERHTIISSGMHAPRALEADIFDLRIYWVDPYYEAVYSANYDGSDVHRVKLIPESSLFDLAIFRDVLCITDIQTGNLYSMNKTTGFKRATTVNFSPEIMYSLAMYNIETQPMPDAQDEDGPCDELGCPHLCLQNNGKAECVCSEGYQYNKNTDSCDEANYKTALVVASRTHICLIDARSFAYQTYEERCIFTVIKAPQKALSTTAASTTTTQAARKKRQATATPAGNQPSTAEPPTRTARTPPPTRTTSTPKPTHPTTTVTTTTAAPTAAPEDEIAVFDLAMENRVVYYASASGKIYSRNIDLPIETPANLDDPIVSASGTVSGLVFDWLSGENLYWCESDTGEFYVVNEANRSPRRVSSSTFVGARDLVLLAHERQLAWIQNYDQIGVIELDGNGHRVLVSGIKPAKYLSYDQDEKNLYWMNTDRDEIYSISFQGEKHTLMQYTQSNAANMIIYKSYIGWTYEVDEYTYFVTHQRTGNQRRVSLGYFDQFEHILDMKMLDKNLQPLESDPCRYQNGNCEKICITRMVNNNPQKECLCPLGFTLKTDGMGCESTLSETADSIFVTDWTNDAIFQVVTEGPKKDDIQAFQSTDAGTYLGVLYHEKEGMLYFGEHDSDMMYKSLLNGGEKKVHLDLAWADVENMALDVYSGNIYYTTSGWSYIGMVTPGGYEVELVDLGFDILRGIAIHPRMGWLYYAVTLDEGWSEPKIVRVDMDGSNSEVILQGDDVPSPYGLAIDYNANQLYWSDMVTNVIQKCDLNGQNCTRFLRDYDANITDIGIDGEFLYYASMNRHHITQVRLDNSSLTTELGSNVQMGRLTHLALKIKNNQNTQPVNAACKDNNGLGNCSTICLPNNAGPYKRRCACKYGTDLKDDQEDQRFCEDIFQCDKTILQFPELIEVKFVGNCDRMLGDECKYLCPAGYEPMDKTDTKLTCLNDGWTRTFETLCKETRCPEPIPNGKWKDCTRYSGEKCTYTCDDKFNPSKTFAVCTNEGIWDEDLNTLCTGHQCSAQIKNGQLALDCQRTPNSPACAYTCNSGYKKNPAFSTVKCGADFQWTVNTDTACIEITCPNTIINGEITACNSFYPGSKCGYRCNPGFTKPPGATQITCLITEKWEAYGQNPCIGKCTNSQFTCRDGSCIPAAKKCDNSKDCRDGSDESQATCPPQCSNSYTNGALSADCVPVVGTVCNITCSTGFTSQGITKVACSIAKTWQPSNVCRAITCPAFIQGGSINNKCGRSVDSYCAYNCPLGFTKNPAISNLKCLPTGQWNQTKGLCLEIGVTVKPEGQSGGGGSGGLGKGIGIGIGLLALILIIVAVVGYLFYRRRKAYKETPYSMSFDSSGSNVAIENPGYMANNNAPPIDDDHNYATVNLDQMQPTKFVGEDDEPPADHGMVNPMFMEKHHAAEASLPEVGHMDLKNESTTGVPSGTPSSPGTMKFTEWKNSQA